MPHVSPFAWPRPGNVGVPQETFVQAAQICSHAYSIRHIFLKKGMAEVEGIQIKAL